MHRSHIFKSRRFNTCLLTVIFAGLICISGYAQKRGIAYGHHTPEDLQVLSPNVSWWYNWSESPESAVANVYEDYGFEFAPMTWNGSFNETKLRNFLKAHPETKYLLAFNEPNFLDQAKMKPSQVAAIWPRLESIAEDFNLEIVGPAVNFCGSCVSENGVTYTDPVKYLDDFFAACPDCKVDHIAVHCYMNHASALKWYISLFEKYNKPIWLTEFSGWEYNDAINSPDDQVEFMIEALEYLENEPMIFRYAWFIGRGSGIEKFPYIDLLGANGELTDLGEVYGKMPVHELNKVVDVPARIEAESYNRMLGMQLERTSDDTGFAHMKEINTDDYLEYKINVPETANYNFDIRVASNKRTALKFFVDGSSVLTDVITDSGGLEKWTTITKHVELEAGEHTIQLKALASGFIINWFEIREDGIQGLRKANTSGVSVYPTYVDKILNVECEEAARVDVDIFNCHGIKILSSKNCKEIDMSYLKQGLYFVELTYGTKRIMKKVIKN